MDIKTVRNHYSHKKAKNYSSACKNLAIKFCNPAEEDEFKTNISTILKNATEVIKKLT